MPITRSIKKEMTESVLFPNTAAASPRRRAMTALTPAAQTPMRILMDSPVRVR